MATQGTVREEWLRPRARRAPARQVLRRAWPSVLAGAVAAVLVLQLAFDAGGYFAPAYLPAGATALACCAFLVAVRRERAAVTGHALVALAALAGLTAWTGLSARWSPTPDDAVAAMQRDLCLLGLFGLGLVAVGRGRYARHLVWGVLAVISIVCGAALLSRLQPDLLNGGGDVAGNFRLAWPLTYWNALGTFAAMGAVLAFGLSADPRTGWPLRALAGGGSVLLLVTMYASLSRGAWLALFAGLLVVVLLGAHRGSLLLTAGAVGVPAVLAIVRLASYDALIDDPAAGQGQAAAGDAYLPQLLVLVGVAVVVQGTIAAIRAQPQLQRGAERVLKPLGLGIAALVAVVLVGGYTWRAADAEGFAAGQLVSAEDWLDRQWDDFMAPAGAASGETGTARLTQASGSRSALYRVALDEWTAHPLAGAGAGSFPRAWVQARETDEVVANAHSLPIETLGELGLVGAALLLAFIGALVTAVLRARLKPGALPRAQVGAVTGAVTVWFVASLADWHWQVTAVTGTALVLACTLFGEGRGVRRRERPLSHDLMDDVVA